MSFSLGKATKSVNDIACVSCKSRKIKCDRARPQCDGCTARRLTCVYLTRKKRGKASNFQRAAGLHKRLTEVEKLLNERLQEASQKPQRAPQAAVHDDFEPNLSRRTSSLLHGESRNSAQSTSPRSAPIIKPESGKETGEAPGARMHQDTQSRLKQAMAETIKCKKQSLSRETASVTSSVSPHDARKYLDSFCKNYQTELFHSFIDMNLMHMIPDLLDKPEVRIQPSTLMLYHVMLYHGTITDRAENGSQTGDPIRQCYVQCFQLMQAWRKQVAGTKTDLITAMLLMRAALQQCDFESSWNLYNLTYLCTVKLDMHVFDKGFPNAFVHHTAPTEGADQYRRGFWGLINTDLVFRLLHGKPAMLTANVTDWYVNLPALEINPELPASGLPNLAFLVRFRLNFYMLRFYEVSEQLSGDVESVILFIEQLCGEIDNLFEEWPIADLMAENEDTQPLWWVLYEVTLTAWCSVMAMIQELVTNHIRDHTACADSASPHPLSVEVARRILQLASKGMTKFPTAPTASIVWGFLRCYVAYGCLVQYLTTANAKTSDNRASDLDLLREVTQALASVAESDSDFKPLLKELIALSETIEDSEEHNSEEKIIQRYRVIERSPKAGVSKGTEESQRKLELYFGYKF